MIRPRFIRPRWRISVALMVGIGLFVLMTGLGSGFFVYTMVQSSLIGDGIHQVDTVARAATGKLASEERAHPLRPPVEDLADLATGSLFLMLVDSESHFMVSGGPLPPGSPVTGWNHVRGDGWILIKGIPYVFTKQSFVVRGSVQYLVAVNPLTHTALLLQTLRKVLLLGGLLLFFSSILGVAVVVREVTGPLRGLQRAVERITEEGRLDQRVAIDTGLEEVAALTEAFNQMLRRLHTARQRERQFVSNAAHSLRTPIHIIRGYINTLSQWGHEDPATRREALTALARESLAMQNLIGRLLQLSRIESGEEYPKLVEVDLRRFMDESAPDLRDVCLHHPLEIVMPDEGPLVLATDPELLQAVLRILVENADNYANADTGVTVRVGRFERGLEVAVSNQGPDIPRDMLPHLFERFYRGNQPASSRHFGLGLAIANLMVEMIGGSWRIESRNHTTTFAVRFAVPNGILASPGGERTPR